VDYRRVMELCRSCRLLLCYTTEEPLPSLVVWIITTIYLPQSHHILSLYFNTPISINQSMAGSSNKRRRDDNHAANSNKKNKACLTFGYRELSLASLTLSQTNNHWKKSAYQPSVIIEPGWQGIFATCERGRESRVVGEFSPILEEVHRIPTTRMLL